MKISTFLIAFIIVGLLQFFQARYAFPFQIDFSVLLIMFFIRDNATIRAMYLTFVLSVGLDLIFQTEGIKGLHALAQLPLVFFGCHLKKWVIPRFLDHLLVGYFALFYLLNYYGIGAISLGLGLEFEAVPILRVLYGACLHTLLFGVLLTILIRVRKK